MNPIKITIQKTVHAPIEKVWDVWTKPEHITQWNFASSDWCCPSASNQLHVGGQYKARMEAKDGSFGFDFEATYNDVVPHKKLSYIMADGRVATTTFETHGESTVIVTVFDAESENPIAMQQEGWQAILNNFAEYLNRFNSPIDSTIIKR